MPSSSSGLGRRPLKAEITGSNPVGGTRGYLLSGFGRHTTGDRPPDVWRTNPVGGISRIPRWIPFGFTLIELMIVIAILAILVTIGIAKYESMIRKSSDSLTKANLGAIRSALSIYYGDNDSRYPTDTLDSLTAQRRYLQAIPITRILPDHTESASVMGEVVLTETGGWSYNNNGTDASWGRVRVGCLHNDSKGVVWSTY